MTYFAVIRETGPAWDHTRRLREQDAWDQHAEFINAASADGLVLLGGALGAGDSFLLMLDAGSEAEIRRRLNDDPWTEMGLLRIRSIERWQQLTGPDLIKAAASTLT